jgi:hypothetical protein
MRKEPSKNGCDRSKQLENGGFGPEFGAAGHALNAGT